VRATLGVSYCPPAYYADLLCERGRYVNELIFHIKNTGYLPRCYLRDYLAPTPNTVSATKHRQFKDELVIEAKQARKCKNFKQDVRTYRSKMMNVQSAAERRQELEDEKRVENKLKAKTFEMAREKFYAGSAERNPWNPKSGGTTFWM
jgi:eukaryotic translation initiation factor 2C